MFARRLKHLIVLGALGAGVACAPVVLCALPAARRNGFADGTSALLDRARQSEVLFGTLSGLMGGCIGVRCCERRRVCSRAARLRLTSSRS